MAGTSASFVTSQSLPNSLSLMRKKGKLIVNNRSTGKTTASCSVFLDYAAAALQVRQQLGLKVSLIVKESLFAKILYGLVRCGMMLCVSCEQKQYKRFP